VEGCQTLFGQGRAEQTCCVVHIYLFLEFIRLVVRVFTVNTPARVMCLDRDLVSRVLRALRKLPARSLLGPPASTCASAITKYSYDTLFIAFYQLMSFASLDLPPRRPPLH